MCPSITPSFVCPRALQSAFMYQHNARSGFFRSKWLLMPPCLASQQPARFPKCSALGSSRISWQAVRKGWVGTVSSGATAICSRARGEQHPRAQSNDDSHSSAAGVTAACKPARAPAHITKWDTYVSRRADWFQISSNTIADPEYVRSFNITSTEVEHSNRSDAGLLHAQYIQCCNPDSAHHFRRMKRLRLILVVSSIHQPASESVRRGGCKSGWWVAK